MSNNIINMLVAVRTARALITQAASQLAVASELACDSEEEELVDEFEDVRSDLVLQLELLVPTEDELTLDAKEVPSA